MTNGNTMTNYSAAATFYLGYDELHSGDSTIPTSKGVLNTPFAPSCYLSSVRAAFFTTNTMLNWTNSAFTNDTTQSYKIRPDLIENTLILAKFIGDMTPNRRWSPICRSGKGCKCLRISLRFSSYVSTTSRLSAIYTGYIASFNPLQYIISYHTIHNTYECTESIRKFVLYN
ncbi:hypothetical protein AOQ84DRAFT_200265 [Glonium stellatum]|uniref:Uncharacterized protein n=1 Tax=Glonium stellatum TaxID=574774 RepID=A0A8E2ENW2_9PEZI|nr:hypothetical protein AOQ84DRAFT_200265 [Glonium stellatum]